MGAGGAGGSPDQMAAISSAPIGSLAPQGGGAGAPPDASQGGAEKASALLAERLGTPVSDLLEKHDTATKASAVALIAKRIASRR